MVNWQSWKNRLCAALFLGALATTAAQAVPVLSITATPDPATVGSSVTLEVQITDVVDLYAYQFSLNFDPSVLQTVAVTEGPFLATGGSTFFDPGLIDNIGGSITFLFDSLIGLVPGVSGSGVLASIQFDVVASGTTPLSFSDVLFLDSNLVDLTLQVDIRSLRAIPEPATLALVVLGMGLAAAESRWTKRL